MEILMEDNDIVVIKKEAGMPTQTAKAGQKDVVSELKNHLYLHNPKGGEPYLGVIHRLDQPVEGILVFAKNPAAAAKLSKQVQAEGASKEYLAVVTGSPKKGTVTLVDYLRKDGRTNLSKVVKEGEPDAKRAELSYEEVTWESMGVKPVAVDRVELHLLKIHLVTGRHHQIRVQMSNAGLPLLGDHKYGICLKQYQGGLKLCAFSLKFRHPGNGKEMAYKILPEYK